MGQAFGIKLIYTKLESISCQSQGCLLEASVLISSCILSSHSRHSLLESSWDSPSGRPALHLLCCKRSSGSYTEAPIFFLDTALQLVLVQIRKICKPFKIKYSMYESFIFRPFFPHVNSKKLLYLNGSGTDLWSWSLLGSWRKQSFSLYHLL